MRLFLLMERKTANFGPALLLALSLLRLDEDDSRFTSKRLVVDEVFVFLHSNRSCSSSSPQRRITVNGLFLC